MADDGTPTGRYYRLQVGEDVVTASYQEIISGDVWARTPDAYGITTRQTREAMAAVILDQGARLDRTIAVTRTGWHTLPDGRRVYVYPDGRTWPDGVGVHIVGMPERLVAAATPLPTPPDEQIRRDLEEIAEHGGWAPLMAMAAGARTLGQSLRPVPYALVIYGDPGTGKSSAAAAARGLILDGSQWPPVATSVMSATVTRLEMAADREADIPTLWDDLALNGASSLADQRDAAAKYERIIRPLANQEEIRPRADRDLTARPGHYVRSIATLTAQQLPAAMQSSLMRRSVMIRLRPGDTNTVWWEPPTKGRDGRDGAARTAASRQALGSRIIARLGEADDPAALLAEVDRHGLDALAPHMDREVPGWRQSVDGYDGVVAGAGQMLGGVILIAEAAGVDPAPLLERIAAPLARTLAEQASVMQDRQAGMDDIATAVGDIIRRALAARRAYVMDRDGATGPTCGPEGLTITELGLREAGRDMAGLPTYEGIGVPLVWAPTYGGLAVRESALHTLAQASGDARVTGYTARSIGKALARAGALVTGGDGRHVKKVVVRGKGQSYLVIRPEVVWPDLDGDDGSDDTDRAVPQDPTPTSGPDSPTPTEPPSTLRPGQESALDVVEQLPETAAAAVAPSAPRPALTTVLAAGVSEHGVTWVGPDGAVEVVDETYESLPDLLKDVIQRMPTGGTIAVSAAAAGRLGYPDKPVNTKPGRPTKNKASKKRGCRAVVEAAEVGWQPSAAGIGAWTAWTGPDRPSVAVVVPEWCGKLGVNGETMIKADHDALAAGYLLARYRQETGVPFAMTAGTAGTNMIRAHLGGARTRGNRKARSALLKWNRTDVGLADSVHESPCVWDRPLDQISDEERAHPYVVGVDVTAAYLSAMIMSVLSWDRLEHTGIPAGGFDKHIQGYWEISQAWQPHASIPDLTGRYGSDGPRIVSTATAQLCLEHGMPEEAITDAWLPRPRTERGRNLPRSGRLLRKVGETIRDAYFSIPADTADPEERHLRATLKATFRETVGMLERGTPWVRRPDWSDTIIATARGNLLRRIIRFGEQTGRWPLRIHTDCVYYAANDSNPKQFGDIWRVAPDDRTPRLGETVIKPENVIDMNTFLATDVRGNPRR